MNERYMNNYLEMMWKEFTVDELRYFPRICLEGRRKSEILVNAIQEHHCCPNSLGRSLVVALSPTKEMLLWHAPSAVEMKLRHCQSMTEVAAVHDMYVSGYIS
jgi:hypothetical protein